ncbi:GNAT family N-acetyltransferase [Streptomyces fuscigenes]|uniref:GNAT family N-acetyltransferase n=1 Tax=Streptomyces fuscigenes TaxID=1528880 RepID=UPI001F22435C|nr:GNAT family N-acetyltransferase [Streptomyces fuscigenes]MCF3962888.1 GNAT family N-acetyltransferase [Streptomyces fuscigenes]
METDDIRIRRAADADALPAAEMWLRSFTAALPGVRRAHDDEGVRAWFRHVLVPRQETWLAVTADDAVAGLLVLDGGEVDQLYLDPTRRRRGLGSRLMDLAKERRPDGLGLWTFQINTPARRFYESHGFVPAEMTGGHRNEEREPDIRYVWRPGAR